MKLKNKKTGEIGNLVPHGCEDERLWVWIDNMSKPEYRYKSLAELNVDWEDYEEPKGWCITMYGGITRITKDDEDLIPDLKEIGNYFNDKEIAYDTLDKLKAWKRLKDKGFKFKTYMRNPQGTYDCFAIFEDNIPPSSFDIAKDLDLLFGGEE